MQQDASCAPDQVVDATQTGAVDQGLQNLSPDPDPLTVEALGADLKVNHRNTIAAGFETDQVISVLLALHAGGRLV